ncbi:ABC transporter substrate-binding protein [Desulfopila sp. IMCC35008]|uniref:ABC transporter substrate-binding protein n=1 Tax=Desulfopila sp. IMCC35008 TaxID=2653858 RepID=UPI0013D745EA|nr:ABC transporter substrate-binding protein [Desulfopila sp. IMCC35008]
MKTVTPEEVTKLVHKTPGLSTKGEQREENESIPVRFLMVSVMSQDRSLRGCCKVLLVLLLFIIAGPARLPAAERPVRLALQWYPQAQFAGYYMAREKGIYAQYGLDVEIVAGGADRNSLELVADGEVDFATAFLTTALQMRARGVELVNIGQIVQRSALMLVARKDSGIRTIMDLDGTRIGTWGQGFQLQPQALFQREGLSVALVRQSPTFELFMRGGLNAVMAMWYNEYHQLISYGLAPEEMTAFFFSELDLNMPEDGIYCLKSRLTGSPETVSALVQATVEGWRYAFANPDETVDTILAIMKGANIRANRAHQKWMLARMEDIIMVDATTLDTRLKRQDFDRTMDALRDAGIIEKAITYEEFYKEQIR